MTIIQWADATWNPQVGCSQPPDSPGCLNCYAKKAANSARLQQFKQYQGIEKWDGTINFVEHKLLEPLKWRSPRKIFVCSMSDLFHENVPFEWLNKIFAVMAISSQHTFQVLTKRPERMLEYFSDRNSARWISHEVSNILRDENSPLDWRFKVPGNKVDICVPLPNVWLGTSVENRRMARKRIPLLLRTPAAKRFLSCEPLLQELDLSEWLSEPIGEGICDACDEKGKLYTVNGSPLVGGAICTKCCPRLDWIICGGESGDKDDKLRPTHIDWLRSLVEASKAAKVPVFVKQLGSYPIASSVYIKDVAQSFHRLHLKDRKGGDINEFPEDLKIRQFP